MKEDKRAVADPIDVVVDPIGVLLDSMAAAMSLHAAADLRYLAKIFGPLPDLQVEVAALRGDELTSFEPGESSALSASALSPRARCSTNTSAAHTSVATRR